MCKHVAAVLYGVGARLDHMPALLFKLRGVDADELLARAGKDGPLPRSAPAATKVLDEGDVAALFGLEMAAEQTWSHDPTSAKHQRPNTSKRPNGPVGRKPATSKEGTGPRTTRRVTAPSPTRVLKRQARRT